MLWLLNILLRVAVWVSYGPTSALVPLFLLYGAVEYGLSSLGSRSSRGPRLERWLDGAVSINCALGIVVWLMRDHLSALLLLLLGISILVTIVTLILAARNGKGRREEVRRPAHTQEGDGGKQAAAPSPRRPRQRVTRQ